jgi:hypothetical protein
VVVQFDVLTIAEIASVLDSLGFIDSEAAERLAEASTTVIPQRGLNTIPVTEVAALTELVSPQGEPQAPRHRMATCWSLRVKRRKMDGFELDMSKPGTDKQRKRLILVVEE